MLLSITRTGTGFSIFYLKKKKRRMFHVYLFFIFCFNTIYVFRSDRRMDEARPDTREQTAAGCRNDAREARERASGCSDSFNSLLSTPPPGVTTALRSPRFYCRWPGISLAPVSCGLCAPERGGPGMPVSSCRGSRNDLRGRAHSALTFRPREK